MEIKFDNTSLTTSPFNVRKMTHENADQRDLNMFELARERGSVLVNAEYKPKIIEIQGMITGSDNADLESHIDEFKELTSRQSKNLDISYSSGTRRFVATAKSIRVERDFFHLNYAPYEIEFMIPSGIGMNTSITSSEITAISSLSYTSSIVVGGSVRPKMKITIDITDDDTVTAVQILANGNLISLTTALTTGDQIVFDENTLNVTLNGVVQDYEGIFPTFVVGANAYNVEFTATAVEYTLTFEYYNTYI